MIDFVYDEFKAGRIPFDQQIFEYNYDLNDPTLKYITKEPKGETTFTPQRL